MFGIDQWGKNRQKSAKNSSVAHVPAMDDFSRLNPVLCLERKV